MEIEAHLEHDDVDVFGFWVYLMTDLVIFAVLFATFLVLRNNFFGGPSARELFEPLFALKETIILLVSTYTCSLAMIAVHADKKNFAIFWFFVTFLLGVSFLSLEITEFVQFINRGASWKRSAFLSAFFTLVGTHGLHITAGLYWMMVEMFRINLRPLSPKNVSKILRMALFWHFLDFVWIFIFTVVYGMSLLS